MGSDGGNSYDAPYIVRDRRVTIAEQTSALVEERMKKGMEPHPLGLSRTALEKIRDVLIEDGHADALIASDDELQRAASLVLTQQAEMSSNQTIDLAKAIAKELKPQIADWREASALPPVTPGTVRVRIPEGLTESQILERLPENFRKIPESTSSVEEAFGLGKNESWLMPCVVEFSMFSPEDRLPGAVNCSKIALIYLAFVPRDVRRILGGGSIGICGKDRSELVISADGWSILMPSKNRNVLYFRRFSRKSSDIFSPHAAYRREGAFVGKRWCSVVDSRFSVLEVTSITDHRESRTETQRFPLRQCTLHKRKKKETEQ